MPGHASVQIQLWVVCTQGPLDWLSHIGLLVIGCIRVQEPMLTRFRHSPQVQLTMNILGAATMPRVISDVVVGEGIRTDVPKQFETRLPGVQRTFTTSYVLNAALLQFQRSQSFKRIGQVIPVDVVHKRLPLSKCANFIEALQLLCGLRQLVACA